MSGKKIIYSLKYIRYYLFAKTVHDIHSPFVYNLFLNILQTNSNYYAYEEVEALRKILLSDSKKICVTDLGAGSTVLQSPERRIKDIARYSVKSAKYGQLLFRLANFFQPQTILEIGTSLGLTAIYLAKASSKSRVVTIEGCPDISSIAKNNFKQAGVKNIQLLTGNFDDKLKDAISQLCLVPTAPSVPGQLDMVFIDGNHLKSPVIRYFNQCLEKVGSNSVFIIDDIHWSDEMEEAWECIKANDNVTITIDLFFMGLVFFRKEQAKEHFVLRF